MGKIESFFLRENRPTNPFPNGITEQVDEDRLAIYKQTAESVGFEVSILATEGEEFPSYGPRYEYSRGIAIKTDDYGVDMIEVLPGKFGILINARRPQIGGHDKFWQAVEGVRGGGK